MTYERRRSTKEDEEDEERSPNLTDELLLLSTPETNTLYMDPFGGAEFRKDDIPLFGDRVFEEKDDLDKKIDQQSVSLFSESPEGMSLFSVPSLSSSAFSIPAEPPSEPKLSFSTNSLLADVLTGGSSSSPASSASTSQENTNSWMSDMATLSVSSSAAFLSASSGNANSFGFPDPIPAQKSASLNTSAPVWVPKEQMFRTKICSFYYHTRQCHKGDKCNFSHEFRQGMEIPPPPRSVNPGKDGYTDASPPLVSHSDNVPEPMSGSLNHAMRRTGSSESVPQQTSPQNSTFVAVSQLYRTKACKFFFEKGSCLKGDRCNFSHDPAVYQKTKMEEAKNAAEANALAAGALPSAGVGSTASLSDCDFPPL